MADTSALAQSVATGLVAGLVKRMTPPDPTEKAVADKIPDMLDQHLEAGDVDTMEHRVNIAKAIGEVVDSRPNATAAEKDFYDSCFVALKPKPRK